MTRNKPGPQHGQPASTRVQPNISVATAGWEAWMPDQAPRAQGARLAADTGGLLPYPVKLAPACTREGSTLDAGDIPLLRTGHALLHHTEMVAQHGLALWNGYLQTGDDERRARFLTVARWLVEHESTLPGGGGGWPEPTLSEGDHGHALCLSALAQASAISVLVRAYQLTGDAPYLATAGRAVITLTHDVLDGGVVAPAGTEGVVFEEVAVYPAAHMLRGFLQACIGLYDYLAFADSVDVQSLLNAAHATLHQLLPHYDTGYWTCGDLLHCALASARRHRLHVALLAALARFTGCEECASRARRWQRYARSPGAQTRRLLARAGSCARHLTVAPLRRLLFPHQANRLANPLPICVTINSFPMPGGMRAVLMGWRQAMVGAWQMEYLTGHVGPNAEGQTIRSFALKHRPFGKELISPFGFPNVWFYFLAGWRGLRRLLRSHPEYALLLPQDGIFTAAFTAAVGRLAGRRVVVVDHGNIYALFDRGWRQERMGLLRSRPLAIRWLRRALLILYWPSLRLLAWVGTRAADFFLVASDDIADVYRRHWRVPAHRIIRFPFMVDADRYAPLEPTMRVAARARLGIPTDAIVVTMINRLAPEKDMQTAVQAIHQTYLALAPALRERVFMLIAGDGPERPEIEREIQGRGLEAHCRLWGVASPEDVVTLLGISDIFLFTGKRSINSMAVLEAMSAQCAVVATTCTRHIAEYLAADRGIAVPVGDASAVAAALEMLIGDEGRRRDMGTRSREYVARHHTAAALRRCLLRASYVAPDLSPAPAPLVIGQAAAHDDPR